MKILTLFIITVLLALIGIYLDNRHNTEIWKFNCEDIRLWNEKNNGGNHGM
jgi:hypothetical protein